MFELHYAEGGSESRYLSTFGYAVASRVLYGWY